MTHPAALLRQSLKSYRHDLKAWLAMVLPLGILVTLFIAVSVFIASDIASIRMFLVSSVGRAATAVIFIAIIAATVFFAHVFVNASVYAAAKTADGEAPNFNEAYRHGIRTFWPVLWVSSLQGLLVLAGLILLVIPGIIWALRYSMLTQAVVLEGKRGMDAFRRSKEMTSGRLLETFIDFGVLGALVGYGIWLAMIIAGFALMIIGWIAASALPQAAYDIAGIIFRTLIVLVEAAIVWAALPLSPIIFTHIYKDFSAKR